MTRYGIVAGLFALVFLSKVSAQQARFPKTPPPKFVLVSAVNFKENFIHVDDAVLVPVVLERAVEAIENGMKVIKPVRVTEYRQEFRTIRLELKRCDVFDGEGTKLSEEDSRKLLDVGKLVLLPQGFEPIDPAFLKLFRKETLILVPKKQ